MSPDASADSYYGRPIVRPPVWGPEIAWYLFAGGLAGASSLLALVARRAGNDPLARAATIAAAAGVAVSPALLVRDLGRPERFYNMLRVVRPSSPMNVGTWILTIEGLAVSVATACEATGHLPGVHRRAELVAGTVGPALATYTGVLLGSTAVPVWNAARFELPLLFASGAATSAAGAAILLTPSAHAGPARRLLVGGALLEEAVSATMERRLGMLGQPYSEGLPRRYRRAARVCTLGAAALCAAAGRHPVLGRLAASAALAGAACHRFSVFTAGTPSALDPRYTVEPQRRRRAERWGPRS